MFYNHDFARQLCGNTGNDGQGAKSKFIIYAIFAVRCKNTESEHAAVDAKNQSKPFPDFPLSAQAFRTFSAD